MIKELRTVLFGMLVASVVACTAFADDGYQLSAIPNESAISATVIIVSI